ncbi:MULTISPECIES: DUF6587 family protein [unclassified Acinetobacter]|jgi:hypothetical protein|uniref:DUF6587 family protein n=1 Tax=unclassified Acinetobacter TaxID=196816 RepID=UPI001EDBB648|nr:MULTISPECIES: DUF6587 family protein [unclassified Acinetobacter]MCG2608560.1 hypothetical protein [Acinetobacter sp. SM34]MDN5511497.1 hypothetical protein [Acinetobacter sp.]MDN5523655.1 hypothetical protein [Acinetobacter sp.]
MIEILIVAALVIWSAVVVFKKVFPKAAYSVFSSLSNGCQKQGWTVLAKWLKPEMVSGCGGSCGCSASDSPAKKKPEVQAVKWK